MFDEDDLVGAPLSLGTGTEEHEVAWRSVRQRLHSARMYLQLVRKHAPTEARRFDAGIMLTSIETLLHEFFGEKA